MPIISAFFGIVIRMFYREHEPPHFHAFYAGSKAQLRIEPIGVLRGDLPPRPLALIVEWASMHRAELLANWDRLRREEPPVRIPPLE